MKLCFVPGEPLATCHQNGTVSGISVDHVRRSLGVVDPQAEFACVDGFQSGADATCDVIAGWLNTYVVHRAPAEIFENYSVGQPYAGTGFAFLFPPEFDDASFIFFKPFTVGVWAMLAAAVAVAIATSTFVRSSKNRASAARTGIVSLLGYSRLYRGKDSSYYQHAISVFTAFFSVIVTSMYASNLVARSYISNQQSPDFATKPVAYQAGGCAHWVAELRPSYTPFGTNFILPSGAPDASAYEGCENGDYFVVLDTMILSALCATGDPPGLISSIVPGMTAAYVPLVRKGMRAEAFDALVYDGARGAFAKAPDTSCFAPDETYVRGFGLAETWSIFALVGVVAVVLVGIKLALVFLGRAMDDVPREKDVIDVESATDSPKMPRGYT